MNEYVFPSNQRLVSPQDRRLGISMVFFMNMTLRSSLPCWNYRTSSKLLKRKTPFLRSKLNHVDQSRCLRCVKDTREVFPKSGLITCYSQPSTGEPHQTFGQLQIFRAKYLRFQRTFLSTLTDFLKKIYPKQCVFFWRLLLPLLIINGKSPSKTSSQPRGEEEVVERGITETPNQRHLIFRSASRASSTTLGSHLRVPWERSKNSYTLFAPKVSPSLKRSQWVETPENGWLEYDRSFWCPAYFQGLLLLVSGKVTAKKPEKDLFSKIGISFLFSGFIFRFPF